MRCTRLIALGALAACLVLTSQAPARAQDKNDKVTCQIIYVPTPQAVVDKMLDMAKVTDKDLVFDLGCGDGRVVATAAKKYGAKGVGIDIDPERIKESKDNAKNADVSDKVDFRQDDVMKLKDLGEHHMVRLTLDVFALHSWDGNDSVRGPDVFYIYADDGRLLGVLSDSTDGSAEALAALDRLALVERMLVRRFSEVCPARQRRPQRRVWQDACGKWHWRQPAWPGPRLSTPSCGGWMGTPWIASSPQTSFRSA